MTVERIGPLDPTSNVKKTGKPSKAKPKSDVDSINVSQEARSKAEVFKAQEARSGVSSRILPIRPRRSSRRPLTGYSSPSISRTA
jgi:hypothetical protein